MAMTIKNIFIFGVSKNREINLGKDMQICVTDTDHQHAICKSMAMQFPGEMYYAWDGEKVIYSYRMELKENFHNVL
jgi:hypothetical protein